eukprot:Platyproteum_vivax@DN3748_c0_g1_i1.p1
MATSVDETTYGTPPLTSSMPMPIIKNLCDTPEIHPFLDSMARLPPPISSLVQVCTHEELGVLTPPRRGVDLMIHNPSENVLYARDAFGGDEDEMAMRQRLVACPNGHLVVLVGDEVGSYVGCEPHQQEWRCNATFGCHKCQPTETTLRYRCAGCNFDMCYGCWLTLVSVKSEESGVPKVHVNTCCL